MLLLAHRGLHDVHPENTMDAFAAAAAAGADGFETDLRLSGDGEVVLYHDRTLPDARPVAEATRREIDEACGFAVPSLAEAVSAFPDRVWNLEWKSRDAAAPTMAMLAGWPDTRFVVTSFDHKLVAEFAARHSGHDFGFLIAHRPLEPLAAVAGVNFVAWYYESLDDEQVRRLSASGREQMVYGVVTLEEKARCRALRLWAVISDRVER